MSYRVKSSIPVAGMFLLSSVLIGMVVFGADHKVVQQLPSSLERLEQVKLVEIKDESGNIVLTGNFVITRETDGDIEGLATLHATNIKADAKGNAELAVEKRQDASVTKELEVELKKLKPATTYNLFVDAQQISSLRTNARGSAEIEFSNRTR